MSRPECWAKYSRWSYAGLPWMGHIAAESFSTMKRV